ncbi:hypothetical protein JCM8097_004184 [Rhodosporidiobolus ruineniae]
MQVEAELSYGAYQMRDGGALFDMPESIRLTCGGTWKWGWSAVAAEGNRSKYGLVWSGVEHKLRIAGGAIEFRETVGRGGRRIWGASFPAGDFPSSRSGSIASLPCDDARSCHAVLTIQLTPRAAEEGRVTQEKCGKGSSMAGAQFAESTLSATPFDVLLTFPRCNREIWTSEALLRQSPYFVTLFSSDFAEASDAKMASPPAAPADPSFDDSDDETDRSLFKPVLSRPKPELLELLAHKTVTITEASYSTYLSVICFLHSGGIDFAPLSSSATRDSSPTVEPTPQSRSYSRGGRGRGRGRDRLAPSSSSASPSESASSSPVLVQAPSPSASSFPPAASPKSVYRLAHVLELDQLASLALSNFRSQLTPSNAAAELFSPLCHLYPDARDVVLDYIAAASNRQAVLASEEMKEKMASVERGEASGEDAAMWAKLAMRLMEAK